MDSSEIYNDNMNSNNNGETDIDIDFSSSELLFKESKTNLIVNYLPQDFSREDLRALFKSYGEIQNCKLVYDKMSGESLCYGFVDFVHIDEAERAASEMNGKRIQNKCIKVSFARPSCDSIKGANLYVSGLPRDWQVPDLNAYFSQCGKIIASRILKKQGNQPKGVGFIRYDQRFEADLAVCKLNNKYPTEDSTEPLQIKFANFPAAITNKQMAAIPLAASLYAPAKAQILNSTSLNILHHHPTTQGTSMPVPPQLQTPNSYASFTAAYNTFAAAVAASNCLPNTDCLHFNQNQHAFTNQLPNTFPHMPNLNIQQANIDPYSASTIQSTTSAVPGWCLFIFNLSPDTEENILWQLFGPFGAVQNVKIARDQKTHKCKGYGFVTMTNYEEAVIAINALNGYPFGNRALQVSFKTSHQNF